MLIEKMTEAHIKDVSELEKLSMKSPWSEKMFIEELDNKFAMYRVCTICGKAVAYMGMHCVCGEGHITNIAVHPDYRRRAIATKFIEHFINHAKENNFEFITLEVRESNTPAISCYKKFGFEDVGVRKNYYEHKENANLMTLFFK